MANGIPRIWPLPPDDELQRVERGRERNAQGFQFIKDDLRSEADRRNAGLFSGGGEKSTSSGASTFTALTDAPASYTGHGGEAVMVKVTEDGLEFVAGGAGYTDEQAQDAIGGILVDSTSIDFTYSDATPSITAVVKSSGITEAMLGLVDNTTADVSIAKHGLAPKAPNDATKFLDGTGAWSVPAGYTDEAAQDAVGAMIADTATIDLTYTDATPELKADVKANSITAAMQHATQTDVLFGRSTAGAGAGEEIACTAAGRAILDDANAAAQLVTLGAAASGANSDITSASGFTGAISTPTGLTLANAGTIDAGTGVGNAYNLRARATTGGTWINLLTATNAALAPTLDFPTGATYAGNEIYRATGTDVPITDGGTGASTAAGALLNITGWVESFVTSANFTTSSTTLVNITGLTFAAAANKTYEIDALLYVDTSAVTTGVKFGVNYSAAGAAMYALISCTSTSTAASISTLNTLGTASANTYLTTSDISGVCHIKGFVTTGANTGNITIQGLKVTSGTLTVYRGSRLMVRELTT